MLDLNAHWRQRKSTQTALGLVCKGGQAAKCGYTVRQRTRAHSLAALAALPLCLGSAARKLSSSGRGGRRTSQRPSERTTPRCRQHQSRARNEARVTFLGELIEDWPFPGASDCRSGRGVSPMSCTAEPTSLSQHRLRRSQPQLMLHAGRSLPMRH